MTKLVPWHWTWLPSGRVQIMYRRGEGNRTPAAAGERSSQPVNDSRTKTTRGVRAETTPEQGNLL